MGNNNTDENGIKCIVTFIVTGRRGRPREWKTSGQYVTPTPEKEGAIIRGWGPEDLFCVVAKLSEVRGKTLTVKVPGEATVETR